MADASDALSKGGLPPFLGEALGGMLVDHEAVVPEKDLVALAFFSSRQYEALERVEQVQKVILPRMGQKDVWRPDVVGCFRILRNGVWTGTDQWSVPHSTKGTEVYRAWN